MEINEDLIARLLFTIGQSLVDFSELIRREDLPDSKGDQSEKGQDGHDTLFDMPTDGGREVKRMFKHPLYIKYKGMPFVKYASIKSFYEEITKEKGDSHRIIPLTIRNNECETREEMVRRLKIKIEEFLKERNFPFEVEKIAREIISGERFEV